MNDALQSLARNDPVMNRLIKTYPQPTFTPHTEYYQELVRSIIGQQLSVHAAKAIEHRLRDLFEGPLPSPEQLQKVDIDTLRSIGFSRPKARYAHDLAEKIISGDITFNDLDEKSNQEIISELTKVTGIGEWTVHMFLIFCMGRLNVLPVGDLGIRNGVTALYNFEHLASPEDVNTISQKNNWQPYESVASWYVWQSLENAPNQTI